MELRGKDGLPRRVGSDRLLKPFEIDVDAEKVRKPSLEPANLDQRKPLRVVEVRQQVYVRHGRRFASRYGAKYTQMYDSGGYGLRFVVTQYLDNLALLHVSDCVIRRMANSIRETSR